MRKLLAIAMGLGLSINAFGADLIVNGDFEDPIVTHPNGWTTYYGQNFTGTCQTECYGLVPGWNVWWTDDFTPGRLEIQRDFIGGVLPFSGRQKAELDTHHRIDNDNNNVVIFQFLPVCEGSKYTLEYSWKSRTTVDGDNDIYVLVDNLIVKNHAMDSNWTTEQVNLVASSDFIHAAWLSNGLETNLGMFVDGISFVGDHPEECGPIENACSVGKPSELTLLYNGLDGSNNDQTEYYTIPEQVADFPNPAYIQVYADNGNKKQELLTSITVKIGGLFTFDPLKNGKIPPKTTFVIMDPNTGETVQTVHFHTSCSQPLNVSDKFGGITVWDFKNTPKLKVQASEFKKN